MDTLRRQRPTVRQKRVSPHRPAPSPDNLLKPQEELFVELYFEFNFNASKAYRHAGYAARNADANAYSKLRQAHIQAAIMRRRAAAREKRAMSREERLQILEECARSSRADWRSRIAAIKLHNEMVGDGYAAPESNRAVDQVTVAAIRAMDRASLIDAINRGLTTEAKAQNIDISPFKIANNRS